MAGSCFLSARCRSARFLLVKKFLSLLEKNPRKNLSNVCCCCLYCKWVKIFLLSPRTHLDENLIDITFQSHCSAAVSPYFPTLNDFPFILKLSPFYLKPGSLDVGGYSQVALWFNFSSVGRAWDCLTLVKMSQLNHCMKYSSDHRDTAQPSASTGLEFHSVKL